MSVPLPDSEIKLALEELPKWAFENNRLRREVAFGSFREAMSFMVRVGFEAEAVDHHPEIINVYNRVNLNLTTHDAEDRVTAKDLVLARRIERIIWV